MRKNILIVLFSIFVQSTFAQTQVFNSAGIAINGYDAVAYFVDNKPTQGSEQFSFAWQGVKWLFASESNRKAFQLNPEKYAPQFGGFCAYGTMQNHLSPTEPAAFTIVNEKLYLNYNQKVKTLWLKDTTEYIRKAEINWMSLKNKN